MADTERGDQCIDDLAGHFIDRIDLGDVRFAIDQQETTLRQEGPVQEKINGRHVHIHIVGALPHQVGRRDEGAILRIAIDGGTVATDDHDLTRRRVIRHATCAPGIGRVELGDDAQLRAHRRNGEKDNPKNGGVAYEHERANDVGTKQGRRRPHINPPMGGQAVHGTYE